MRHCGAELTVIADEQHVLIVVRGFIAASQDSTNKMTQL